MFNHSLLLALVHFNCFVFPKGGVKSISKKKKKKNGVS